MAKHVNPYYQKEDDTTKAKVSSQKRPAIVQVKNDQKAAEIQKICDDNEWFVKINIKPGEPEDVSAVDQLLNPPKTIITDKKIGRNDPCSCGSGKKYKQCCGK